MYVRREISKATRLTYPVRQWALRWTGRSRGLRRRFRFKTPPACPSPTPDGSITFGASYIPTLTSQADAYTLRFELSTGMYFGAPWNINSQPAWIDAPVAWPGSGTL